MRRPFIVLCFLTAFHAAWCQEHPRGQETVLDRVVHLEDSIHYAVPALPRLCDSVASVKDSVDLGGCTLFVEMEGHGTPMVLINGGPWGNAPLFPSLVFENQRHPPDHLLRPARHRAL